MSKKFDIRFDGDMDLTFDFRLFDILLPVATMVSRRNEREYRNGQNSKNQGGRRGLLPCCEQDLRAALEKRLAGYREEGDDISVAAEIEKLRARMGDLSEFREGAVLT